MWENSQKQSTSNPSEKQWCREENLQVLQPVRDLKHQTQLSESRETKRKRLSQNKDTLLSHSLTGNPACNLECFWIVWAREKPDTHTHTHIYTHTPTHTGLHLNLMLSPVNSGRSLSSEFKNWKSCYQSPMYRE